MTYTIGLIDENDENVFESNTSDLPERLRHRLRRRSSNSNITSALEVLESMSAVQKGNRSSLDSEQEELMADKREEAKGAEFIAVISRLYIYNVIKDHRSKTSTNNPSEKESQLFDFLLNVNYPVGTDIKDLNNIIDTLGSCCRYLIGRDPRFYSAPFKVNQLLSNSSYRINENRGGSVFVNLLDDNKILHSFIMAMHDINRKIRSGFEDHAKAESNSTSDTDSSGHKRKRRASLIDFTKSLERKKSVEKFEYLLLSKLCAVLQLLSSCCMEMYRSNRLSLIKALVLAFNRVMIEEDQFTRWFAVDGLIIIKKLHSSGSSSRLNGPGSGTRTERAMNTILPKSVILHAMKLLGSGQTGIKYWQNSAVTTVIGISDFFENNWRSVIVTVSTVAVLMLAVESFMQVLL